MSSILDSISDSCLDFQEWDLDVAIQSLLLGINKEKPKLVEITKRVLTESR